MLLRKQQNINIIMKLQQGEYNTDKLQRVDVYIANQTYCENQYREGFKFTVHPNEQVCAFDPSSEKGSCQVDFSYKISTFIVSVCLFNILSRNL
jgi:hypothetical protein